MPSMPPLRTRRGVTLPRSSLYNAKPASASPSGSPTPTPNPHSKPELDWLAFVLTSAEYITGSCAGMDSFHPGCAPVPAPALGCANAAAPTRAAEEVTPRAMKRLKLDVRRKRECRVMIAGGG